MQGMFGIMAKEFSIWSLSLMFLEQKDFFRCYLKFNFYLYASKKIIIKRDAKIKTRYIFWIHVIIIFPLGHNIVL